MKAGCFLSKALGPAASSIMLLSLLPASTPGESARPSQDDFPTSLFRDVTAEAGVEFDHFTGSVGEFYMPEIMGPGVALFDYDGDGDLDIFVLQGNVFHPAMSAQETLFPPRSDVPLTNRLFRNDSQRRADGTLELRFTDVTEEAGVGHAGYGMGVAVGDYNNNGLPDLYVTNFGSNVLYRNNGDGTFTDVTRKAGVDDPRWSTSAAFCDVDGDGHPDLIVVNYIDFTVAGNRECFDTLGARDFCTPNLYNPVPDRLFRNRGDGTFEDVTEAAGLGSAFGPGLGVVCADFNGNGKLDVFVANDADANQLWINQGDWTFLEDALLAGVAFNADGLPEASMGIAAGDFDNDGDEDIFVTHLTNETNTLYVNDGSGNFHDRTIESGLGDPSHPYTGFGTEWFDYDNDGHLDLFVANGAVTNVEALRGHPYPYHQINQLFRNLGNGKFEETTRAAGPEFEVSEVSRGAAFGDLNQNGRIDVVVTNNNGPLRILLNQVDNGNHWLKVRLHQEGRNLEALGAYVTVHRDGKPTLRRRCHTDGSYLSARDATVHFGLGAAPELEAVTVEWPDGTRERWTDVETNRLVVLEKGTGECRGPFQ